MGWHRPKGGLRKGTGSVSANIMVWYELCGLPGFGQKRSDQGISTKSVAAKSCWMVRCLKGMASEVFAWQKNSALHSRAVKALGGGVWGRRPFCKRGPPPQEFHNTFKELAKEHCSSRRVSRAIFPAALCHYFPSGSCSRERGRACVSL